MWKTLEDLVKRFIKGDYRIGKSNIWILRTKPIGYILKAGVIISFTLGLLFHFIDTRSGFTGDIFRAFTIQSNLWIATLCAVFLVMDIFFKNTIKPLWLHVLKFMFTVSILLTYIVFSILLAPLVEIDYLLSLSNIFLHTVTAILALMDFL